MDVPKLRSGNKNRTAATVSEADKEVTDNIVIDEPTESQRYRLHRDLPLEHFLSLQGIVPADLKTLRLCGYPTVRSVSETANHVLETKTGFTDFKVKKLKNEAKAQFPLEFVCATEMHQLSADLVKISTGSQSFDATLRGGIETGFITAVFGESGSGKSQMCMTLAVNCQKPIVFGGAEGKCIYIDTVGGFRAERVSEIAAANNMDVGSVLRNIVLMKVKKTDELFESFKLYMIEQRIAFMVVDSFTTPFRVEYEGRQQLPPRQFRIQTAFSVFRECISLFGIGILAVCDVIDNPDTYGPKKIIAGGNVVKHSSHNIIQLKSTSKPEEKIAVTYKFAFLPQTDTKLRIGPKGIEEA